MRNLFEKLNFNKNIGHRVGEIFSCYPMVFVCLALILGIVLCEGIGADRVLCYSLFGGGAVVALLVDFIFKRSGLLLWLSITLIGFIITLYNHTDVDADYDTKMLYTATVKSSLSELESSSRFSSKLTAVLLNKRDTTGRFSDAGGEVLCYLDSAIVVNIGDTISFEGKLRRVEGGYGEHLMRKGIVGKIYGYNPNHIAPGSKSFMRSVEHLRQIAGTKLYNIDTSKLQATAIMRAMTIGQRDNISKENLQNYRNVGASHLLAISGLHIGIIVMLLNLILGSFKVWGIRGRVVYSIAIIIALWGYALLSGMSVSVERAVIMFTLYQIAILCNRSALSINVLATSAVILLVISPLSIYDVGAQLSYGAMIGISIFYRPLSSIISSRYRPLQLLFNTFSLCLSAQIMVMPLIAYHFGMIQWLGLVIAPLIWLSAPLIVTLSLLYIISSITYIGVAAIYVAELQNTIFAAMGSYSWAVIDNVECSVGILIALYVFVFALGVLINIYANRRSRKKILSIKMH